MGYSGMKSFQDSDTAADMVIGINRQIVKALKKEVKSKGDSSNTSGPVNVALYLEDFVLPLGKYARESLCGEIVETSDIFERIAEGLVKEIKSASEANKSSWENEKERKYHLKRFKELLKVVRKCVSFA